MKIKNIILCVGFVLIASVFIFLPKIKTEKASASYDSVPSPDYVGMRNYYYSSPNLIFCSIELPVIDITDFTLSLNIYTVPKSAIDTYNWINPEYWYNHIYSNVSSYTMVDQLYSGAGSDFSYLQYYGAKMVFYFQRSLNAYGGINFSNTALVFRGQLEENNEVTYYIGSVYGGSTDNLLPVVTSMTALEERLTSIYFTSSDNSYKWGEYRYNEGYNSGFNDGFYHPYHNEYADQQYYNGLADGQRIMDTNWFTSFLSSMLSILEIEIFPNIKLVYLAFIPIGLGLVMLIFKFIRGS